MNNSRLAGVAQPPRIFRAVAALLLATGLSACGIGGTGDTHFGAGGHSVPSTGAQGLKILTTGVPAGSRDVEYPVTRLSTSGARGPVTWSLVEGSLPAGVSLTEDGSLLGAPTEQGFFEFTVRASDGLEGDLQTLALAVDRFGVSVVEGLTFGDAWSGRRVDLSCAGFTGPVEIEIVANGSGGSLVPSTGGPGDARYVPGEVGAQGATDVLRATDTATGATATVELRVRPDPTDAHVARFGSTDVWYLDCDGKHGAHAHASDFQRALALLGLRDPQSTDRLGSEADRLAETVVRLRLLEQINVMYLRKADGTAGAAGLPISFPFAKPGSGYALPAPGSYAAASTSQFSVMAICDGTHPAVVGTAYTDGGGNPLQEHNAPGGPMGSLGTFVSSIAPMVRVMYRDFGTQLEDAPVGADDVPALHALLHGLPSPGGRHALLDYTTHALARCVAAVAAHEIGHSLGLPHASGYEPGAIMSAGATFSPLVTYHFMPAALATLRANLPGAGRAHDGYGKPTGGASAGIAAATLLPVGGVHVCDGSCDPR